MKINRTKCKITGDNIWQINFTINNIKENTANVLKQANFIELISNVSKELVENINYENGRVVLIIFVFINFFQNLKVFIYYILDFLKILQI